MMALADFYLQHDVAAIFIKQFLSHSTHDIVVMAYVRMYVLTFVVLG